MALIGGGGFMFFTWGDEPIAAAATAGEVALTGVEFRSVDGAHHGVQLPA